MIFAGNVDGSISAAREDVYARPGTRSEVRWSTIMEDLRRRDFSINAVALSLNAASRGLLLDPTNGLADVEKREVRALSIHSFTNQPVRLLRAIRYAARMDFKLESRTEEWFALAMERGLAESIAPEEVGRELRQLGPRRKARGDSQGLGSPRSDRHDSSAAGSAPSRLRDARSHRSRARRTRCLRIAASAASGPVTAAVLGRLKSREISATISRLGFRSSESSAVLDLEGEAQKAVKILAGRKTAAPKDAYAFLEQTPPHLIVFLMAESSNTKVTNKIRNYLAKWRPLRQGLPAAAAELEASGRRARTEVRQSGGRVVRPPTGGQGSRARRSHQAAAQTRRHQGRSEEERRKEKVRRKA